MKYLLKSGDYMYVNSGNNPKRTPYSDENLSEPLYVRVCGNYKILNEPVVETYFPNGRSDYQLLYIHSGKAHFYFDGVEHILTKGHMVLYRPGQPQIYYYYGTDKPDVYFVHFAGHKTEEILKKYLIPEDSNMFFAGISPDFQRLFLQIILELQLLRPNYERFTETVLEHIFIMINRALYADDLLHGDVVNDIEKAMNYFIKNYDKPISIENYAKENMMSKNWFIHCFKNITKVTPMQYILSLRISAAKNFLENTEKNISQIANAVGYDNALYFSRLFRKHTGYSPSDYRKLALNSNKADTTKN